MLVGASRAVLALLVAAAAPLAAAAPEDAAPAWKDYAPVVTLEGHTSLVRAAAFAPDGDTLATAGADRSLRLWDPETGEARGSVVLPRGG